MFVLGRCFRALSAFFYFVALDPSTGRPLKVPALQPQSDEERQRFEEGKARYEVRKQRRLSSK